jgi:hypothetical protein
MDGPVAFIVAGLPSHRTENSANSQNRGRSGNTSLGQERKCLRSFGEEAFLGPLTGKQSDMRSGTMSAVVDKVRDADAAFVPGSLS